MRLRSLFPVLFAALLLPGLARAADCYFHIGTGQGKFDRSFTEKLEERILGPTGILYVFIRGTYDFEERSRPREYGGGCLLGRYAALEFARFSGFGTKVTGVYLLCAESSNLSVCSEPEPMERRATLEGTMITALGRLPLGSGWEVFLRLGAMHGDARVMLVFPRLGGDPPLALSIEERGTVPVVGLGASYRFAPSATLVYEQRKFDLHHSHVHMLSMRFGF